MKDKKTIKKVIFDKWIGILNKEGRKSKGEKMYYEVLRKLKKEYRGERPMEVLEEGVYNIIPLLRIVNKKKGGAYYKLPAYLSIERGVSVGMKWLVKSVVVKGSYGFSNGMYIEVLHIIKGEGEVIRKKNNMYEEGMFNRAFLSYLV